MIAWEQFWQSDVGSTCSTDRASRRAATGDRTASRRERTAAEVEPLTQIRDESEISTRPQARRAISAAVPHRQRPGPPSWSTKLLAARRRDRRASRRFTSVSAMARPKAAGTADSAAEASPRCTVRRAAAEALGRIGDDRAAAHLSKHLADAQNDRVLEHSLTYALIEIGQPRVSARAAWTTTSPRVRRACLTALDQLGEKLDPKVVLDAMKSTDAALKETAQWIVGRHPEWADELVRMSSRDRLADPKRRRRWSPQLAKFASTPRIQQLLADVVADPEVAEQSRPIALASDGRGRPEGAAGLVVRRDRKDA